MPTRRLSKCQRAFMVNPERLTGRPWRPAAPLPRRRRGRLRAALSHGKGSGPGGTRRDVGAPCPRDPCSNPSREPAEPGRMPAVPARSAGDGKRPRTGSHGSGPSAGDRRRGTPRVKRSGQTKPGPDRSGPGGIRGPWRSRLPVVRPWWRQVPDAGGGAGRGRSDRSRRRGAPRWPARARPPG